MLVRASPIHALPTLLTVGNLMCGFTAIALTRDARTEQLGAAIVLIYCAMLLDGLDGVAARRLSVQSRFGQLLDCLADMVSFGVAPAMIYLVAPTASGPVAWAASGWLCCATALRLARFAAIDDGASPDAAFIGLPCPASAGVIAGATAAGVQPAVLTGVVFALGVLMVSRVPYPRPVGLLAAWPSGSGTSALLVAFAAALVYLGGYAPLAICVLFVLSPLRFVFRQVFRGRASTSQTENA